MEIWTLALLHRASTARLLDGALRSRIHARTISRFGSADGLRLMASEQRSGGLGTGGARRCGAKRQEGLPIPTVGECKVT